jgi:tetratricopeptide (TPR) repeat protein
MAIARPRKLAVLSVAILTCVVYLPSLRCGFIWDDNAHVTRPELRSYSGLYHIWFDFGATQQYYPLLHTAFWIEQKLWGEQAWAYHLVNVLEHAGAACLVYLILQQLQIPGALLAAMLFAVHPVQVESVAWITEQKNTLSALFYLSAMLTYLNFDVSRQPKRYALAAFLFVLGLLTKTVTVTLPAALLVIFWWQRGTLSWQRDVRPLAPWFILGAAAGLCTALVERNLIGAEGALFQLSVLQRSLLAGRVIWFYIAKLVWPSNLLFIYPRWEIDAAIWWQWLFPSATIAVFIGFWLLRRRCRGPLACWLFYVGTLFPALGFFNVFPFIYSFVADHFQYLASLGMFVLFAGAVMSLPVHRFVRPAPKIVIALSGALVAMMAMLSWRQIQVYADNVTLFQNTLRSNPNCWMAHNNLGFELMTRGNLDEATNHFQESLRLNPSNWTALLNMGLTAEKAGRIPDAIHWYEEAISKEPTFFFAHYHLGHALLITGHPKEAVKHFSEAIRLRPEYPPTHFDCGTALVQLGENGEAMLQYAAALQLQPDDPDAHHNLAFLLAAAGHPDQAVAHFQKALRLRPNFPEADFNMANTIAHDAPQEAIQHYRSAIQFRPDYAEAYANLACTYAQIGESTAAIAAMRKAIDLAQSQHNEALTRQLEPLLRSYQEP